MNRRLTTGLAAFALAFVVTGCGGSGDPEPVVGAEPPAVETTTTVTIPVIAGAARAVGPAAEPEATPLDPEEVVTATVVIATGGDLEAAIAAGVVGEAEAEAALRALEDGSVGDLFAD